MRNIEMINLDKEDKEDNMCDKLDLDGVMDLLYIIWKSMESFLMIQYADFYEIFKNQFKRKKIFIKFTFYKVI